jgi:hypothetical protein
MRYEVESVSVPALATKQLTTMKTLKRLIYVLQVPVFFVYLYIPFLRIFDLPYWVFSGRNLMDDWCVYNEI